MILDLLFLAIFYGNFPEASYPFWTLVALLGAIYVYIVVSGRTKPADRMRIMLWMLVIYELLFQGHYGVVGVYAPLLLLHAFFIDRESYRYVGHGSSYWAGIEDMERVRLFQKTGLILGKWRRKWLRYKGEGHILTCAPNGAGKGTCVVIPNLLTYRGSVFVNDIKGENYQITADHRRQMGQNIICLDPFSVVGSSTHTMNWLDFLDPDDPNLVALAQKITDMLIIKDPKAESHWNSAATALLKGVILHVACYGKAREAERTMVEVRRLLVLSKKEFKQVLKDMQANDGANGVVRNVANMMLQKSDREFAAVISTVHHYTDFLDDPRVQTLLSKSNNDWQSIGQKTTSVYFIIPPDKLSSYLGLVRATIILFLQASSQSLARRVGEERTLFLLDEFSQLGYMQPIEDAISLIRGYGVTLWLLIQDLSQIEAVYPKWRSFLSNVTVFQVFGTNDQFTAEYISQLLGTHTARQGIESDRKIPLEASHTLGGEGLIKRPLLMPDEVRKLGSESELLFIQGQPPMHLWKVNYLFEKYFKTKTYKDLFSKVA